MIVIAISWNVSLHAKDSPHVIRVLTYNIHHGEGTDARLDLERIAAVINSANPDLVALQEVDRSTERSGGVDQTARLSKLTRLHGSFGEAMPYKGGGYGLAILSRWPLLSSKVHPLPVDAGIEPRIIVDARVRLGDSGPEIGFAVTHLDHRSDPALRVKQVAKLGEILPSTKEHAAAVLAGDFNATPDSAAMQPLFSEWTDTAVGGDFFTIPARVPRRRIDHILCRPAARWEAIETRALDEPTASDHRPLLAVLKLKLN